MAPSKQNNRSRNAAGDFIGRGLVYLKHRRLIALLVLFSLAAGLTYYVYDKPLYFAKAKLRYRIVDLPVHSETAMANTPYFRLERSLLIDLRQRNLIERTARRLGLVESTGNYATIAAEFVNSVRVQKFDADIIFVDIQAYDPTIARVWAEAMAEEYREYREAQRDRLRDENLVTYTRELGVITERLEESLEAKLRFEEESNYTETALRYTELAKAMGELYVVENQLAAAQRIQRQLTRADGQEIDDLLRLALYRAEVKQIEPPAIMRPRVGRQPLEVKPEAAGDTVVIAPTVVESEPRWKTLRSKKDELVHKRTALIDSGRGAQHEDVKRIDRDLELLDREIMSEARNQISAFEAEYRMLGEKKQELEALKPEFQRVSGLHAKNQQRYILFEESSLSWEKAHKEVKGKIEALSYGGDKERIHVHFEGLEQFKDTPISPNKMKLAMVSLALALALGVGVPIGLEYLNDTASKIDELEEALGLPGLGVVPVTPKGQLENIVRSPEIDARIPNSLLENFRIIRANIVLNRDYPSQVIMITSARPSEGKTVNACNLGWAFASLEEPTLVIDSDLRRGRVHSVLDIPNEKGLSSALNGECDVLDVIQKTKVPNLWALTRGPIVAGTTEKLSMPEFDEEIAELRKRFKRIIIDSPPVLGLSETGSLKRLVDGIVLIIRAERTTQRDVVSAATLLQKAGANFFGFVLNRLDLEKVQNYYNYYYYSSYYYEELGDDGSSRGEPLGNRRAPRSPRVGRRPSAVGEPGSPRPPEADAEPELEVVSSPARNRRKLRESIGRGEG